MVNLAATFKALADPTRLRVLNLLLRSPLCVCEIGSVLGLPQPLLSRHLAYLRNRGIVESRRNGMRVEYAIGANPFIRRAWPLFEDIVGDEATGREDLRKLRDSGFIPKPKARGRANADASAAHGEVCSVKKKRRSVPSAPETTARA
jgi:ArsR family transcriptional regulator